jgi:hypothetical protein
MHSFEYVHCRPSIKRHDESSTSLETVIRARDVVKQRKFTYRGREGFSSPKLRFFILVPAQDVFLDRVGQFSGRLYA